MGYAVKLQKGGAKPIYCEDEVTVALTGSHTGNYVFVVCYVSKAQLNLISKYQSYFTGASAYNAYSYSWNWDLTLPNGKRYKSSDTGQEAAKIPTQIDMYTKCSTIAQNYDGIWIRNTNYWNDASNAYLIWGSGTLQSISMIGSRAYCGASPGTGYKTAAFIHVYL